MTAAGRPDLPVGATATWAVIDPSGNLTWYPEESEAEVRRVVGGKYNAFDGCWLEHSAGIRLMASDVGMLFPDEFPPNYAARQIAALLSRGQVMQPWRGHVAISQYARDPDSGEFLWAAPMDARWRKVINRAHDALITASN